MATLNSDDMTTQADLYAEIKRQQHRLIDMPDPVNRQILSSSIIDLLKLTKEYPQTLWIKNPEVADE